MQEIENKHLAREPLGKFELNDVIRTTQLFSIRCTDGL